MAFDQGYADALAEIEALKTRLKAAEIVCTIFGWTAAGMDSERDKAVHQAWSEWYIAYGNLKAPRDPEWDALITELAAKRDEIRTRTLARIRGEGLLPAQEETAE